MSFPKRRARSGTPEGVVVVSVVMWITSVKNENCQSLFQRVKIWYTRGLMEKFVTMKKVKRQRKHGFLAHSATNNGKKVLQRRRSKGRKSLTI